MEPRDSRGSGSPLQLHYADQVSITNRLYNLLRGAAPRVLVLARGSDDVRTPHGDAVLGRTLTDLARAGVQTHLLSTGGHRFWGQLVAARQLRGEIRRFRPGVILALDVSHTAPLALLAASLAPTASLRLGVRGSEVPDVLDALYHPIRADVRRVFQVAERIVIPSETALRHVQDAIRRPTHRFAVYPLGVADLDRFTPPDDLEDLHHDAHSCFVVGCVAPLAPGHGHNILLPAFARLASEAEAYRLRLELLGDGPLRGELRHQTRQLGIEQFVGFFPRVSPASVPGFLRGLHGLIHPTRRVGEGLSLPVLEAMACGVPVIASRIGAVREYVRPGFNGDLVTPGSVDELAEALRRLRDMPPEQRLWLARQASRTARDYVGPDGEQRLRGVIAEPDDPASQAA